MAEGSNVHLENTVKNPEPLTIVPVFLRTFFIPQKKIVLTTDTFFSIYPPRGLVKEVSV